MDIANALETNEKSLDEAEREYLYLKSKFEGITEEYSDVADANDLVEQVKALELQNTKLIHRLAILKQGIDGENERKRRRIEQSGEIDYYHLSVQDGLTLVFRKPVQELYPSLSASSVVSVTPSNAQFADYQCNAAMPICQALKPTGEKLSPYTVAKNILTKIPENDIIEKCDVGGPGFINIWLKPQYLLKRIADIFTYGLKPPINVKRLRVAVDFSSPNVAKEMHVGHLRSTIIGDSISNLLAAMGHDVLRLNHVGDWGTQFGMLIAHLQDMFPNYLTESPSVNNLQRFYKESKIRFDTDEAFKKRAYECVVRLQKFDDDYIKAWELICDASRREFQKIYNRLNINIIERGESFYQKMMNNLVEELEEKGLLEDDEGRKLLWGQENNKEKSIPLTVVKSDGGFTYDTSDLAALKHRIEEEKVDWLIYVVDEGQAVHFETVVSGSKRAGFLDPSKTRVDFVGFGVVLGEDKKKFKTRSGDTVKLVDLLDEGLKRSIEKLKEKKRDEVLTPEEMKQAQEAIAYGCIKYADLSHNRNHAYIFSFDKMLEDKGNTAVYLLYTYTRIASIARNANITREQITEAIQKSSLSFDHEKEFKLAKTIIQFYDAIQRTANDLCIHRLCEYMYDLCTAYSEFYDNCYVIEKTPDGEVQNIHMQRILLCEVTALVIKKCFDILGLRTVTRM